MNLGCHSETNHFDHERSVFHPNNSVIITDAFHVGIGIFTPPDPWGDHPF